MAQSPSSERFLWSALCFYHFNFITSLDFPDSKSFMTKLNSPEAQTDCCVTLLLSSIVKIAHLLLCYSVFCSASPPVHQVTMFAIPWFKNVWWGICPKLFESPSTQSVSIGSTPSKCLLAPSNNLSSLMRPIYPCRNHNGFFLARSTPPYSTKFYLWLCFLLVSPDSILSNHPVISRIPAPAGSLFINWDCFGHFQS